MTYNYKCGECDSDFEININTSDMVERFGVINQNKLEQEMHRERICECGGMLKKVLSQSYEPVVFRTWFNGVLGHRFGRLR